MGKSRRRDSGCLDLHHGADLPLGDELAGGVDDEESPVLQDAGGGNVDGGGPLEGEGFDGGDKNFFDDRH